MRLQYVTIEYICIHHSYIWYRWDIFVMSVSCFLWFPDRLIFHKLTRLLLNFVNRLLSSAKRMECKSGQTAIYSVFTIYLELIFHVYEMHQCDFISNAGACILFLAEVFLLFQTKNIYKDNFKMWWCLRWLVIQREH